MTDIIFGPAEGCWLCPGGEKKFWVLCGVSCDDAYWVGWNAVSIKEVDGGWAPASPWLEAPFWPSCGCWAVGKDGGNCCWFWIGCWGEFWDGGWELPNNELAVLYWRPAVLPPLPPFDLYGFDYKARKIDFQRVLNNFVVIV